MSQPEEIREKSPKTDAVLHPPTANPDRTQLRDERDRPDRTESDQETPDRGEDEPAGTPPTSRKEP
ncbi:hypothetical protein ACIBF5_28990 [Micromonospora sp. NPDC050417]|uniref:hypothetical protein n=1 Tax=Micromonospora sp. NPDC050417 TaxID=3364280 RepID=UPI0037930993